MISTFTIDFVQKGKICLNKLTNRDAQMCNITQPKKNTGFDQHGELAYSGGELEEEVL